MSKYIERIELSNNTSSGKIINWINKESVILEFGPSSGRITKYLSQELQCRVYIVEKDEEDYKKAINYAVDGVCGDLMDFEWAEKFSNVRFDYILFTDVLEHLTNPRMALSKAITFLKENGEVLISVPNIAHNDIILSLFNNQFRYTPRGILDDTHVHFWGYYDLDGFFSSVGLKIIEKDAVYQTTFTTEQNLVRDKLSEALYNDYLKNREYGEVYQFVLKLKKKGKGTSHSALTVHENTLLCNIYYNRGDGYSEIDKRTFYISKTKEGYFSIKLQLYDNDIYRIRFDPVEDAYCMISEFDVKTENGTLDYSCKNSVYANDSIYFTTSDPQIEIDIPNDVRWVELRGKIITTTDSEWIELARTISNDKTIGSIESIFYYDRGRGFNCEDAIKTLARETMGVYTYKLKFPSEVTNVRFDPVEGVGCLIKNVCVKSAADIDRIVSNGVNIVNGFLIENEDPQILIVLDKPVKEMILSCKMELINYQ